MMYVVEKSGMYYLENLTGVGSWIYSIRDATRYDKKTAEFVAHLRGGTVVEFS